MMAVHWDAAINDANLIISAVEGDVAAWNLQPSPKARQLSARLRELSTKSPIISSAWVLDGDGISRLDTWTYPARPIDGKARTYFQKHLAGASDPVVASDVTPGAISGLQRFTFSKALRNPDGSIHAIIVVAVPQRAFDTLYAEAANWPQARAGLYVAGEPLATLQSQPQVSDGYLAEMNRSAQAAPSGSELISDGGAPRLMSWRQSAVYPGVYATSSQSMAVTLANWKIRSAIACAIGLLAILGFVMFGWRSAQASAARKEAFLNELALREAHHRVKNSLNLMVSMIGLQARSADPETRAALRGIAARIHAIADAHELLQKGPAIGRIDVSDLLRQLCSFARLTYLGELTFESDGSVILEAKNAITIALVANELITNGMKHARSRIDVNMRHDGARLIFEISDDGPGLPDTFSLRDKKSFGLSAVMLLVKNLDAELSPETSKSGTVFTLRIPLRQSPTPHDVQAQLTPA
jgi:two-component sensor histidine kinase